MNAPPSKEAVLEQLSLILRSSAFRNSEMLRNFLSFVVREKVAGREDTIKQYSIALNAFGRSVKFDASADPIVRIQAGRLRSLLDKYYYSEGMSDPIRIVLPKGIYIPLIEWSVNVHSALSSDIYPSANTIAVFPIKNLSVGGKMQILVDGFAEELQLELSRYKHLNVIRAAQEPNTLTRKSLARFSLECTIRIGEQLAKIALILSDNLSLEILWTLQRKFDISTSDLIGLQEEIAADVALQIAGLNGVVSERLISESNWEHTRNPSAYNTYLYFHKYTQDPSPENADRLMEKVTMAVEADPQFGPGWAVLARLCCDAYVFNLQEALLQRALFSGQKAVELQSNHQSCQAYYAYALMVAERFDEAKMHCKKALKLNPNSIHDTGSVGFLYCLMDLQDNGRRLILKSISRDFRYPWWFHIGIFAFHLNRNEYDLALQETQKINTSHFWFSLIKLVAYHKTGDPNLAMASLVELMELKPDFFDTPSEYICALVKNEVTQRVMKEALDAVIAYSEANFE